MNREYEILKRSKLRYTERRKKIISILLNTEKPLSPEEIYDIMKTETTSVNLSTVYRALQIFERKGIVIKTLRNDGIGYYSLNTDEHKHLIVCKDCGRVQVIRDCPLDDYAKMVAERTGYEVLGHDLEFTGLCPECKENHI